MTAESQNGLIPALSSDWRGVSRHLIASIFAVRKVTSQDKNSIRWERDTTQPEVQTLLTDGNMDTTLNWQSPFENVGPDQKFSSFSALLQAGGFSAILSQLKALFPDSSSVDSVTARAKSMEGRSNLTKLNSTQIFNGMPPVKINVTAHFRAYQDADREVRQPLDQLMEWAVPKSIAADGPLAEAISGKLELFPSEVPQIIGLKYGDLLLAPLVIEAIPYPLTSPRDRNGVLISAALPLQIASLTAWDRNDWRNARASKNLAATSR